MAERKARGSQEESGEKDSHRLLIIFVILVLAAAAFIYLQPQETDSGEHPYGNDDDIEPVLDSDLIDGVVYSDYGEETLEGPLTSVYFYKDEAFFGLEDHNIMQLRFADAVELEAESSVIMGDRVYYVESFDFSKVSLFSPETYESQEHSLNLPFTIGKVLGPVKFRTMSGTDIAYYYLIREYHDAGLNETYYALYFYLASTSFNLQFGKKLFFAGTDSDLDGTVDEKYYDPALSDAGFDPQKRLQKIAHFYVDEDGDGSYDLKFFIDTSSHLMIESVLKSYPYQIQVSGAQGIKGKALNQRRLLKTPNGSLIVAMEDNTAVVRIPKDT